MNAVPAVLKQIIREYGREVVDDPLRVEGLLRDLAAPHRREVFLLVQALRAGVVQKLLDAGGSAPMDVVAQQAVRGLQADYGLTLAAACWAVETWAGALDIAGVVETVARLRSGADNGPERRDRLLAGLGSQFVVGRRRKSLRNLNEFIERNPDDPEALATRADIHRMLGRDDLAIDDANAALVLNASSAVALRVRGEISRRSGELQDALRDLSRAIQLDADQPQALLNRGELYRELARPKAALADLDRSIALEPSPEAFAARSVLHAEQERHDLAMADLKRALALGGDDPDNSLTRRVRLGSRGAMSLLRNWGSVRPAAGAVARKMLEDRRQRREDASED